MISRRAFDAYSKASASLVNSASARAEKSLRLWFDMHPDATAAEARQQAIELIDGMAQTYSESASSLAARFYDEQAAEAGIKLEEAVTEISYDAQWATEKMRWAAGLYEEGNVDGFVDAAAGVMANSMKRSLNDTIMKNAKRDKEAGVRFARVPTGSETCAFCFMLATRGAVYHTRESAGEMGQYHPHCDCKVMPGFGGSSRHDELVEGWRPEEALERLKAIERETGCHVDGKDWKASEAVTESMRLRDKDWLYYGKLPSIDYSDNPRSMYGRLLHKSKEFNAADYSIDNIADRGNEWRDLFVHDALRNAGFDVKTFGSSDIDLKIGGDWWEIKSPVGNSQRAKENNLRKARRQFEKRDVKDAKVVLNSYYLKGSDSAIERELSKRMKQHGVGEALLIEKDGSVIHIKQ